MSLVRILTYLCICRTPGPAVVYKSRSSASYPTSPYPTAYPTTPYPSRYPTIYPTSFPTITPTLRPTSMWATAYPTGYPTRYPSPTSSPTFYPTKRPTVSLQQFLQSEVKVFSCQAINDVTKWKRVCTVSSPVCNSHYISHTQSRNRMRAYIYTRVAEGVALSTVTIRHLGSG
jgi:hypothetical protein